MTKGFDLDCTASIAIHLLAAPAVLGKHHATGGNHHPLIVQLGGAHRSRVVLSRRLVIGLTHDGKVYGTPLTNEVEPVDRVAAP